MNYQDILCPGMEYEEIFTIREEHLAPHVGSGAVRVLATPWMIAFMERVSHLLVKQHLPDGYSSVGVSVNVQHLAPTPLGCAVRVSSELAEVEGKQLSFNIKAWDEHELIGSGQHRRVVIEEKRFLRRVETKSPPHS